MQGNSHIELQYMIPNEIIYNIYTIYTQSVLTEKSETKVHKMPWVRAFECHSLGGA